MLEDIYWRSFYLKCHLRYSLNDSVVDSDQRSRVPLLTKYRCRFFAFWKSLWFEDNLKNDFERLADLLYTMRLLAFDFYAL